MYNPLFEGREVNSEYRFRVDPYPLLSIANLRDSICFKGA